MDDGLDDEPLSARDRKRSRLDDDEEFVIDGSRPKSRRLRDQAMGSRKASDRSLLGMDRGGAHKRLKAVRVRVLVLGGGGVAGVVGKTHANNFVQYVLFIVYAPPHDHVFTIITHHHHPPSSPSFTHRHHHHHPPQSPMGKLDGNQQFTGMGGFLRGRTTLSTAQLSDWSREEELLLCAIVFDFGTNWLLVSDMITSCDAVQGTCRRPEACKHKFKQLGV